MKVITKHLHFLQKKMTDFQKNGFEKFGLILPMEDD